MSVTIVSETFDSRQRAVDVSLGLLCIACVEKLQHQFGKVVQRKRLGAKLSQEALSEQAGLHRTYVGLLERGKRMPSILVAKKIAEALGTTMAELLAEVDREPVTTKRRAGEGAS